MKIFSRSLQILSDTKTPVSLFLALRDEYRSPLLLESSDYNSKSNHYSFLCFEPIASISIHNKLLKTEIEGSVTKKLLNADAESLNQAFTEFINVFEFDSQLPDHFKGLFGYCSFNIVEYTHELALRNHTKEIPELLYHLYSLVLVFNHANNELSVYSHSFSENDASKNLGILIERIDLHKHNNYCFDLVGDESSNCTDEEFMYKVTKAKQYCQLGEVFQLVVSRRFYQGFKGDDFNVYRALKKINPSPYLFYFDTGNFKIFGSSPEAQLKITKGITEIHPIAGTYKRTGDDAFDILKSAELLNDAKENAEHVMLVDLARNDLSKYSRNVGVKSYKQIQFYSHVIHMVSNVSGELRSEFNPFETLSGTFPAGTLSGAPKHRAIQLIDELENDARGFYGGTIGFVGQKNELNQAIIIRSFLSKNNRLTYQAGAGIVVSSNKESELHEVFNKINGLRNALSEANSLFKTNSRNEVKLEQIQ
jgi:anthranilate synthase component 1